MSDPLQFASLTLEDEDIASRGVIATEETATFAAAASATNRGDDAIEDEPLASVAAAPAPAPAPAAAPSYPDEPPPPYESIVMGTASSMVRFLEDTRRRGEEQDDETEKKGMHSK